MTSSSHEVMRSLRITDAERRAILDKLDLADADNPAKNRRGMARVSFRKVDLVCRIYHPGGSMTASAIATRNLSAGGTSFLYNGFLHKNTKVELVLLRRQGGEDVIAGVVTHCQLLQKTLHQIGVRFNAKIFPKLYIDPSEWGELGDGGTVDVAALAGRVLHFDPQEMDRLLLKHFLGGTKIELTSVATIEEAKTALKTGGIDCVLCDGGFDGVGPDATMAAMRDAGFVGPIGILTAETAPAKLKAAQAAGAGAVLGKPYDAQKLMSLLGTWMAAGAGQAEALYSTLPDAPTTKPLVEQYVQRVRVLARDLRKFINADELAGVRAVCQTIRGTGSGFGFAILTQIAKEAVDTLDTTSSITEAQVHLQRLELTCRRMSLK